MIGLNNLKLIDVKITSANETIIWLSSCDRRATVDVLIVTLSIFFSFISSPELAQGELLGYRDVRRTCGRP